METETESIENLQILNHTIEALNGAEDVRAVLNDALTQLVSLMGMETGWVFLRQPSDESHKAGESFVLAAHIDLPPAVGPDRAEVWQVECECQTACNRGRLTRAYNQVRCSRLASFSGDRRGLAVHATVPLRSRDRILGILNVAAPDWSSFQPTALTLLGRVGEQMGIALERAQHFEWMQERRLREQSDLLKLSSKMLSHPELEDLLETLVQEVRRMLNADGCALLLPAAEPDILDFRAASGWRFDPVLHGRQVSTNRHSGPGMMRCSPLPTVVRDLAEGDLTGLLPAWYRAEDFRGHVVMPLIAEDRPIGALMIDMRRKWQLDEDGMRMLQLISNQAAIAIKDALMGRQNLRRRRLEAELAAGREIQLGLLPSTSPEVPGWEVAAFYQAAGEVGGDFYDFVELPSEPDMLGLVIADVVGKGIPAALYMALSRTTIRASALTKKRPAAVLQRANRLLLQESHSGLFLTALYAVLDTGSGRIRYANAGHNRPLWLRSASGEIGELNARGTVLGALEEIKIEECEIDVAPGDLLAFYTDGVTEAMDASGQLFGQERLREAIGTKPAAHAQEVVTAVVDALKTYVDGAPQSDDLTLFVVKRSLPGH